MVELGGIFYSFSIGFRNNVSIRKKTAEYIYIYQNRYICETLSHLSYLLKQNQSSIIGHVIVVFSFMPRTYFASDAVPGKGLRTYWLRKSRPSRSQYAFIAMERSLKQCDTIVNTK